MAILFGGCYCVALLKMKQIMAMFYGLTIEVYNQAQKYGLRVASVWRA